MIYQLPDGLKLDAKRWADPTCPQCHGDGYVTWTPNSDPTGGHDYETFCRCVFDAENSPQGDGGATEDVRGDAWEGGLRQLALRAAKALPDPF